MRLSGPCSESAACRANKSVFLSSIWVLLGTNLRQPVRLLLRPPQLEPCPPCNAPSGQEPALRECRVAVRSIWIIELSRHGLQTWIGQTRSDAATKQANPACDQQNELNMAQKTPKTEAASPGTRRDTLPRAPSRLRPAARSDKRLSSPAAWTLSL